MGKNIHKKINILLVMPPVSIDYQDWPVPPVGITYISAVLKQRGFNVFCLNLNIEEDMEAALKREILEHDVDLFGTGGLIVNYHIVKSICHIAKAIRPNMTVYIGGSLVTFSAEAVMKGVVDADFGMLGEGEETVCELAKRIEEGSSDFSDIAGLIIRKDDGSLEQTLPRQEIMDLDSIPFPDYDGFDYFKAVEKFWNTKETGILSAPLTTSRSCPFNCTFCSKSGGTKYRQRSLDNIFEELDWLVNTYHVNRILLNDELFAVDKERINEFCNRIKTYGIKWFVSLRVSKHITKELLLTMKESGCVQVLYGLESGSDEILKSMRKGITVKEIERVVRITDEVGFQVRGNFIFGDTMETLDTVNETLDFIENNMNAFTSVALSPIILFPGSQLYQKALIEHVICDELDFIEKECPIKNVSKMSDEEYLYMVDELLPKKKARLVSLKDKELVKKFETNDKETYKFEYVCPDCGRVNIFYIHASEVLMRVNQYSCKHCKNEIMINTTYQFFKICEGYIRNLSKTYNLAFWGCGQNYYVMTENIDISDIDYKLLDTNPMKIGNITSDKREILSPDNINNLGIDCIIAMTSGRNKEIIDSIQRNYKGVKKAISIFELPIF